MRGEKEGRLDAIVKADAPVGVPDQKETGKTLEMVFYGAEAVFMARSILGDTLFPSGNERECGRRLLGHGCL